LHRRLGRFEFGFDPHSRAAEIGRQRQMNRAIGISVENGCNRAHHCNLDRKNAVRKHRLNLRRRDISHGQKDRPPMEEDERGLFRDAKLPGRGVTRVRA